MKRSFSVLAIAVLGAALWASPALAGTKTIDPPYNIADFHIPFQFVAVNTTLPAGHYMVQRVDPEYPGIWTLTNKRGTVRVDFTVEDAPPTASPGAGGALETKVVFDKIDGTNYLAQFWLGGPGSGRQVEAGHVEEQLLDNEHAKPVVKVVNGTARRGRMAKSS